MKLVHVILGLVAVLLCAKTATANEAPVANAGADQTVGTDDTGKATVNLVGTATDADTGDTLSYTWTGSFSEGSGTVTGATATVTLPVGTHTLTLTVTDAAAASGSDTVQIIVEDRTGPVIEATTDVTQLWPPNHKMVPVTVTATATDNVEGEMTVKVVSVTSDEPENGNGDGNTAPDWAITGDLTVQLRAERAGGGDGRVYTLTLEATDAAGNVTTKELTVLVPHDQGTEESDEDSDSGELTSAEWDQVLGAVREKDGKLYNKVMGLYDGDKSGKLEAKEKRKLRGDLREHLKSKSGKGKDKIKPKPKASAVNLQF